MMSFFYFADAFLFVFSSEFELATHAIYDFLARAYARDPFLFRICNKTHVEILLICRTLLAYRSVYRDLG